MANLSYRYTYTDESVITVEFICGDAVPAQGDLSVIVRCDECTAGDFDCDNVHAVADRMLDDAREMTHGRFPADDDDLHNAIVERLMQYRADASLTDHEAD